jgi:hypothetical protein
MGRIVKRPIPMKDYRMHDRDTPERQDAEIDPRGYLLALGPMLASRLASCPKWPTACLLQDW